MEHVTIDPLLQFEKEIAGLQTTKIIREDLESFDQNQNETILLLQLVPDNLFLGRRPINSVVANEIAEKTLINLSLTFDLTLPYQKKGGFSERIYHSFYHNGKQYFLTQSRFTKAQAERPETRFLCLTANITKLPPREYEEFLQPKVETDPSDKPEKQLKVKERAHNIGSSLLRRLPPPYKRPDIW